VDQCTIKSGIATHFSRHILCEFLLQLDSDESYVRKANLTTDIALQKLFSLYLVKYLTCRDSVRDSAGLNEVHTYVRHFARRVLSDGIDEIRFQLYVNQGLYFTVRTKTAFIQQLLV
jgi:hypothetical protein